MSGLVVVYSRALKPGVQIMSPAFESQPEQRVVVPKSQWFPKRAELTAEPNGAEQPASGEIRETR
jgi:hypothetical protein